jgi:membrane-associated phospholipid phosphatase
MARRRHTVRPFLPVVGALVITAVAIGPVKLWTKRMAPSAYFDPHPELLFHDPTGTSTLWCKASTPCSYPSGHVVNTVVWYGVLAVLLAGLVSRPTILAIRSVVPAVVVFTTTYLSFHWLTDGIAGLLLGLFLNRVLIRVPWDAIPLGRLDRSGWGGPYFAAPPGEPQTPAQDQPLPPPPGAHPKRSARPRSS